MEELSTCILCDSSQIETVCALNQFARCKTCGHYFDNPRPNWNQIVEFYSQHDKYDDWLREESARDALWQRRLALVRRVSPEGRLLDVGAGIGQFLNFARSHYRVEGTEISRTALEIARTKYQLELHQGALEDIRWPEKFDVITLFHVLEHVPYPKKTLELCRSLLAKGGVLVIAVPNDIESILTRRNRLMKKLGARKYQPLGEVGLPRLVLNGSEIHLSHFTSHGLRRALEGVGLKVIQDSLDPYFSASGFRKLRRFRRYYWYKGVNAVTGLNLYDTIWTVARNI